MPSNGRPRRADAVYENGPDSWPEVSTILSKHPMISRPKHFFSAQTCSAIYAQLMEEAGLENSEANNVIRAKIHEQLARPYYNRRVLELREAIAAEEESSSATLVKEIDEIRDGLWDDKIRAKLGIANPQEYAKEPLQTEQDGLLPEKKDSQRAEDAEQQPQQSSPHPQAIAAAAVSPSSSLEQCVLGTSDTNQAAIDEEIPTADHHASASPQDVSMTAEDQTEHAAEVNEASSELNAEIAEGTAAAASAAEMVDEVLDETTNEETEQLPAIHPVDEQEVLSDVEVTEELSAGVNPEHPSVPRLTPEEEVAAYTALFDYDTNRAAHPEPRTPEAELMRQDGKRKAEDSEVPIDFQREKKRTREDSEPVDDDETSVTSAPRVRRQGRPPATDNPVVSKRFQNMIGMLHSQISQHRNGNIFHNPIRKIEAPDYHDIVKRPMDLKTIKARIKDGLISNSLEFQRDVYLMFANAMMYNRPGSEIYNMAEEMMLASEAHINTFRQTEGFHRL